MGKDKLTLTAVGDMILDTSKPDDLFELVAPILKDAEVSVGQGELPFTLRGISTYPANSGSSLPCDPKNIGALARAGFDVITTASNHAWDAGAPGVEDTLNGMAEYGLATCGLGMNIDEARKPAIIEREGVKFGFLAYNAIGPKGSWATYEKPGCAHLKAYVAYEEGSPTIGGIPIVHTYADQESLQILREDISKLRPQCDILVVTLHKGIGYVPALIADFEKELSYAAIDCGADLIVAHHAHILKGIEVYKGKAIYHGLGDFAVSCEVDGRNYFRYGSFIGMGSGHPKARSQTPEQQAAHTRAMIREHGGPFAFGENGKNVHFPPMEINFTMIAKCKIEDKKITRYSFIPAMINEFGQPEPLKDDDARGLKVADYVKNISESAGLQANFRWVDGEVEVY